MTLDELIDHERIDRIDFIKCDAEGAEVGIFSNAVEMLKRFHPKIAVTTYHKTDDYDRLYELFSGIGLAVQPKGLFHTGHGEIRVNMLHAWYDGELDSE